MSEIKKYTINIWLKNNGAPFIYRNCIAYEKGSFYCVYDGEAVYKYPLSDIWRVSESYPQDMQGKNNHNALWQKSVDSEERAHLEKLVPDLNKRIAELEAERRWIPVGERLPEEKQSVLALDRTGTAYHWEYSKCLSNIFVGYYTHWMPLPEPPEVK